MVELDVECFVLVEILVYNRFIFLDFIYFILVVIRVISFFFFLVLLRDWLFCCFWGIVLGRERYVGSSS